MTFVIDVSVQFVSAPMLRIDSSSHVLICLKQHHALLFPSAWGEQMFALISFESNKIPVHSHILFDLEKQRSVELLMIDVKSSVMIFLVHNVF